MLESLIPLAGTVRELLCRKVCLLYASTYSLSLSLTLSLLSSALFVQSFHSSSERMK